MPVSTKPETQIDTLNDKQRRFAEVYAETLNVTQSAIAAGYSAKTAGQAGSRLLTDVKIREAVRQHHKRMADATLVDAVHVIRDLATIAFADPAELSGVHIGACRHCHGIEHRFQWIDQAEFDKALAEHALRAKGDDTGAIDVFEPSEAGGYGYDHSKPPVKACTQCRGDGHSRPWIADTRRLTGAAKRLYAGSKVTRDGIQILTRDQDKALELLGKHLGVLSERLRIENDPENPIAVLIAQVQGTALKPVANPKEDEA